MHRDRPSPDGHGAFASAAIAIAAELSVALPGIAAEVIGHLLHQRLLQHLTGALTRQGVESIDDFAGHVRADYVSDVVPCTHRGVPPLNDFLRVIRKGTPSSFAHPRPRQAAEIPHITTLAPGGHVQVLSQPNRSWPLYVS